MAHTMHVQNLINESLLTLWVILLKIFYQSIKGLLTCSNIIHRLNLELNDSLEIIVFKQIECTLKC